MRERGDKEEEGDGDRRQLYRRRGLREKVQMADRRGEEEEREGTVGCPLHTRHPRETAASYHKCHHLEREWWASPSQAGGCRSSGV